MIQLQRTQDNAYQKCYKKVNSYLSVVNATKKSIPRSSPLFLFVVDWASRYCYMIGVSLLLWWWRHGRSYVRRSYCLCQHSTCQHVYDVPGTVQCEAEVVAALMVSHSIQLSTEKMREKTLAISHYRYDYRARRRKIQYLSSFAGLIRFIHPRVITGRRKARSILFLSYYLNSSLMVRTTISSVYRLHIFWRASSVSM